MMTRASGLLEIIQDYMLGWNAEKNAKYDGYTSLLT